MAAPPQRHTDQALRAERDATIMRLRIAGWTERRIATHVQLSPARVHEIIADAIRDLVEPEVEELRKITAARLDDQRAVASAVRARPHFVVQTGKIVNGPDGRPLIDDGPVLAANDQLRKIDETEIRLYGLAPKEPLEITLQARADLTVNAITAVIDRLQLPRTGRRSRWSPPPRSWKASNRLSRRSRLPNRLPTAPRGPSGPVAPSTW